jgi:myo-inositol 2-dehydrogenase / D-chiro-inositol 1-dehydrogenase
MADRIIRVGIVGCGRVTETRHLPALRYLEGAEVAALADISVDRLNKVADLFHIKPRYDDYQRLLEDPSIDAVAVCVPAQFHVEISLAALDGGKHVFIEKPLALRLDDCDLLTQRAKRSSSKVMVGFNLRWHRLVRQAREMIQQGHLARVDLMRTVLTSYQDAVPQWRQYRERGGGVLFELAVHHFDLWRFLLRSEVEEVSASTLCGLWEDEAATVTARMANGVLVTSVFAERTSESHELEIYGQAGRLKVSCYDFDGLECFSTTGFSGDIRNRLRRIASTVKELPRAIRSMGRGGDFIASYRAEWSHFSDAIRRNIPIECTIEDGVQALRVVLAAARSASTNQPVNLSGITASGQPSTKDYTVGRP